MSITHKDNTWETIDEKHMAKKMFMAEVSGRRRKGRPKLGWMIVLERISQFYDAHE